MKIMFHVRSRRNSTRRRRKVAARHRPDGHWNPHTKPMFISGKVTSETGANIDVTSFGGIAAVHRLANKLGLVDDRDRHLQLL